MEKIRFEEVEDESIVHEIYCDDCGKLIGTSEEYDDGWYEDLGEIDISFYLDKWYKAHKNLCKDCCNKWIDNVKQSLINLGFKEE